MKLINKILKKLFARLSSPLPPWEGLGVGLLLFVGSASLLAQENPFPNVNFRRYQGSMTITAQVVQNGQIVTDAIVAVYCGETIRGKKNVGSGTNPELAYLIVYGNNTIEQQQLYFKVYTSGIVFTYSPSTPIIFKNNSSIGTGAAPYIISLPVSLSDNADNTGTLKTYKNTDCDVVLTGRTLYKDGTWNTLCLPFALSAGQIAAHTDFADATLMELDVTGKNGFDPTDGTLYLTFKKANAIAAGVPYIVKWTKADGYDEASTETRDLKNPVFSGVTIDATDATTVSDADDKLQEVQMVGCYSPMPVTADDKSILFLGNANTLYYSTIDNDIRSFRAYFSVPYIKQNAGVKASAFHLDFGEEDPNLVPTLYRGETEGGAWYFLDGRKLNVKPTTSGVYVHEGRKVVIK